MIRDKQGVLLEIKGIIVERSTQRAQDDQHKKQAVTGITAFVKVPHYCPQHGARDTELRSDASSVSEWPGATQ